MPNKTHVVQSGDTFELISKRYFGEPSQAGRIRSANPGATGLSTGTTLIIPVDQEDSIGTEKDGVIVRIGGVSFEHVSKVVITRRIDAVDTVQILAPLAQTEQFRELIQPLSFRTLEIADGGAIVFRGTMTGVVPELSAEGSRVRISGYSVPGILGDCMMPASAFPLEFRKMSLADIAAKLLEPFSVPLTVETDVGAAFRRVKVKRTDRVLPFLVSLAQQRQVLLRSSVKGDLVLAGPPKLSNPVATFKEGEPPMLSIKPEFDSQRYFSHITGVKSTRRGRKGSQHTVLNPLAQEIGVMRPMTISIRDVTSGELPKATQAAAGRMLAGAVTYTVTVPTRRTPNGALWQPGDTVEVTAPSVFIYNPYQFQIRSVKLDHSEKDLATLLLMLPGAFGGTPPDVLPWT